MNIFRLTCNHFFLALLIFSIGNVTNSFVASRLSVTKKKTKWVILLQPVEPASQRGGEEGLRPRSQEGQDLSAVAAPEQLIFKTCTENQTVQLTNKDLTKDSKRFSPWFPRTWRTTGPIR
jgi:hypothetical protein